MCVAIFWGKNAWRVLPEGEEGMLMYPKSPKQCLAHSRLSTNISWINKCIKIVIMKMNVRKHHGKTFRHITIEKFKVFENETQ